MEISSLVFPGCKMYIHHKVMASDDFRLELKRDTPLADIKYGRFFDRSCIHRRGNFLLLSVGESDTSPKRGSINVRLTESGTPLKGSLPD